MKTAEEISTLAARLREASIHLENCRHDCAIVDSAKNRRLLSAARAKVNEIFSEHHRAVMASLLRSEKKN